jgi:predicted RNA-binding Zn-ribbon protein involved in translation (DUF1610 family)
MLKTNFRHLGYYSELQDIRDLFGRNADYIVKYMLNEFGAFTKQKGNVDTDISGFTDEYNPNEYQLTTNGDYLVKFERGTNNDDNWFIDIYERYEVIDEDDEYIWEYCPHCDMEVKIPYELKVHICPNCGKHIVACKLCETRSCASKCPLDALCRKLNGDV